MVVFSRQDREIAQGIYQDMAEAVAAAVSRREASIPRVYVAAFQHRFGVDLWACASRELAEAKLVDVMVRECARNPELRERVQERFGAWPAQSMGDEQIERLLCDWPSLAAQECLWVAECDVESTRRHSRGWTHADPPPPDVADRDAATPDSDRDACGHDLHAGSS
jgi:hypothetical protein